MADHQIRASYAPAFLMFSLSDCCGSLIIEGKDKFLVKFSWRRIWIEALFLYAKIDWEIGDTRDGNTEFV